MAHNVHLEVTANGNAVEGESSVTSLNRANTIECLSFGHVVRRDTSKHGPPTGRERVENLEITKCVDKSSPILLKAFALGETIEGRFKFFRVPQTGDGIEEHFLTIAMENARIDRFKLVSPDVWGKEKSDPPEEWLRFVPGKLTYTYEATGAEHTTEFFNKKK